MCEISIKSHPNFQLVFIAHKMQILKSVSSFSIEDGEKNSP